MGKNIKSYQNRSLASFIDVWKADFLQFWDIISDPDLHEMIDDEYDVLAEDRNTVRTIFPRGDSKAGFQTDSLTHLLISLMFI